MLAKLSVVTFDSHMVRHKCGTLRLQLGHHHLRHYHGLHVHSACNTNPHMHSFTPTHSQILLHPYTQFTWHLFTYHHTHSHILSNMEGGREKGGGEAEVSDLPASFPLVNMEESWWSLSCLTSPRAFHEVLLCLLFLYYPNKQHTTK